MTDIDLSKIITTLQAWQGETVYVIYQARNVNQELTVADNTPVIDIYKGDALISGNNGMSATTTPGVYVYRWLTENFSPGTYKLVARATVDGDEDAEVISAFEVKEV